MVGKTSPNRAAAITSYRRALFGELLPAASKGEARFLSARSRSDEMNMVGSSGLFPPNPVIFAHREMPLH